MNTSEISQAIDALRETLPPSAARCVVLFGSSARGEAGPDSDVDLFLAPRGHRGERRALRAIRDVEERFGVRCSVIVSREERFADVDRQLLESIVRAGVPLVGRPPAADVNQLDLEPVRLLALNLARLGQREKVRLERELFGYVSSRRHGRRVYRSRSSGFIRQRGGRRIGRSVILVPENAVPDLEAILERNDAKRVLVPAWVQRP